jgi:deazaflavin-dependent oxidoreductase (nitroreductase family)
MPPIVRRFFWYLNKFFMVPVFRLGLGWLFCNPLIGYIMVLKPIGRKTGKTYYVPTNYAIHQGKVYCVSGGRKSSDWYRNLKATPEIDVIMPGGAIRGHVEEIDDPELRRVVIRKILQNAGFAGFFEGYNPYRISDDELTLKTTDLPLLRIQPIGLGSGASDPGGWAWVMGFVTWFVVKAALAKK